MKKYDDKLGQYRSMVFGQEATSNKARSIAESAENTSLESLSDIDQEAKIKTAIETLETLAQRHPKKAKLVHGISRELNDKGEKMLHALQVNNVKYFEEYPKSIELLEVIVRTDGTRPSYLLKNDRIDFSTGVKGEWDEILVASGDRIAGAMECLGRIELSGQHIGTGFLIAPDLIATNQHVLQDVGQRNRNGNWELRADAGIDFGRELNGIGSRTPRKLKAVAFAGDDIDPSSIDHTKLDLALIELEPIDTSFLPLHILGVERNPRWADTDRYIITAGYPGDPGLRGIGMYGTEVLSMIFDYNYGFKRLSPGKTMQTTAVFTGRATHDASTLGGNSGSLILSLGNEGFAAGIHYGGRTGEPRENWGHILGNKLQTKPNRQQNSLEDILKTYGAVISNN